MIRRSSLGLIALVASISLVAHAERPEPGNGYDANIELFSVDSTDGRFRVWYVTESADAVQVGDVNPMDGVPDFAVEVADVAVQNFDIFTQQLGFRSHLIDTDYLDPGEAGGDDRFDIYLSDFANADGSFNAEACNDEPFTCAGYFMMDNDFEEFSYPSDSLAIRTLVSHEYFHAIQAAYDVDQDIKWSEGTAVWAEEMAFPEQGDYEALLRFFLEKPFRPFDRDSSGSFGDLYPYGAALWPTFLTERFGQDVVREIWQLCEEQGGADPDFLTATDELLQASYGSTLAEAWLEFTRWNLFTGDLADPSRAYEHGGDWVSVAMEDQVRASGSGGFEVSQQTEGMSARYTPVVLPDLGGETRVLSLVTESGTPAVGTAYLVDGDALGDAMEFVPDPDDSQRATLELTWQGTPTLYVIVTGVSRGSPMRTATIALSSPGDAEQGGCQAAPQGPGGALAILLGVMLACSPVRRRRPGDTAQSR